MQITQPPIVHTPDTPRFLDRLAAHASRFDTGQEVVVARAPGRLDVMGGIADYSGSLVLQLPIAEATFAAVQARPERTIAVTTLDARGDGGRTVEVSLDAFGVGTGVDYTAARDHFRGEAEHGWAAYVAGVPLVLMREKGATFPQGLTILIASDVPEGKGVSSSAAIEVATMSAVAALTGVALAPEELGALCQKVENLVVGAPCGIMDQMTSACGQRDRLLALLCQPATILGHVAIPGGLSVWGIDSGIRHAVSGADYGTVRTAAFMGLRMLNEAAAPGGPDAGRWRYLANVTPAALEQWGAQIPAEIGGAEFLARYGGTSDMVTRIDPARRYPVLAATRHPIGEHQRIREFAELLALTIDEATATRLGAMMFESHASYSACGLGSEGTDSLVDRVRKAGPARGLYGAKITGGGSGGTVAILGRSDAEPAVRAIAERYATDTGRSPYLFRGSSPGATAWGTARVRL